MGRQARIPGPAAAQLHDGAAAGPVAGQTAQRRGADVAADMTKARSQADMPSIRAIASSAPYGCRYGSQRGSL
jgi:hypothetical protein